MGVFGFNIRGIRGSGSVIGGGDGLVTPAGELLLLDQFGGAAAAYSVRLLSSSYSGGLIRARRSSDNAETDVFPDSNNEISLSSNTGAGSSFGVWTGVSSGNSAFVVTWYDQSGNSDNITQTTASAQPKIISSGSLVTLNSKAGVDFGSGDLLTTTLSTTITQPNTYLITFENGTSAGTQRHYVEINDPRYVIGKVVSGEPTQYAGSFLSGTTVLGLGIQYLQSGLFNTTSSSLRLNGSEEAFGSVGALDNSTNFVMGGNGSNPIIGIIQEYIIYNTNNSTSLPDIESNINTYYNIYWDGSQTSLLDDYPSASAAYSVRALNSAYTGPLLRVRRSSDNAEQDVYALFDGNLDEDGMLSFVGANNGFVVTWYDQSGNGNDWTQTTAANQMQLVSSGSIILKGGKPALTADGVSDTYTFSAVPLTGFLFSVMENNGAASFQPLFGDLIITGVTLGGSKWEMRKRGDASVLITTSFSATAQSVVTYNLAANNTEIWVNGTSGGTDTTTNAYANATQSLKALGVANFGGDVQEIVVYATDQSASRSAIESNINDYYSIY